MSALSWDIELKWGGPPAPLAPEGEALLDARDALADATRAAKEAALAALAAGMSESEASRRYGVTRMTIRAWRASPAGG